MYFEMSQLALFLPVSGGDSHKKKPSPQRSSYLAFGDLSTGRYMGRKYLRTTNWELSDLSAGILYGYLCPTPRHWATALYSVFWDLCKCPSGSVLIYAVASPLTDRVAFPELTATRFSV